MFPVILVYLGLITVFVGGVSVLRPLKFLAIGSRAVALAVVAAGAAIFLIGETLPATENRVAGPRSRLDQFMPAWQFSEFHSLRIAAPRARVYAAFKQVTAEEILFFRTLVWLRRFGRSGRESLLNPPPNTPVLDVAVRTEFIVLAEDADHEVVLGALVAAPRGWRPVGKPGPADFMKLSSSGQPGFAVAALNFRLEDCEQPIPGSSSCTLLTTETRVYATDAATRRRFARYWRIIYPGSALIRRMWLRAAQQRAERP